MTLVDADASQTPATEPAPSGTHRSSTAADRLRRALGRPFAACLVLLTCYVALSFLNDTHGYLGTDTGGKVATLRSMERNGGLDPDVGYWAEQWDPTGRLHPLYYTSHLGEKWVNATTLPALYAAYPLYRLGGYRLALLLPMAGAVLTALAARALARRLGDDDDDRAGWRAFWVVGLLSPLAIYALDFWEHSLGVGLMLWASVLLLDLCRGRAGWRAAGAAGLLIGASATMRTESLVYGAVAVGGSCLIVLVRGRRLLRPVILGLAVSAGVVVPLAANVALERATVGRTVRSERVSGTAVQAGSVAGDRLHEAGLTAVGFEPNLGSGTIVVGLIGLALVMFAAVKFSSGDVGPGAVAAAGVAAIYLLRFREGLGFVPGLVAASPLAGVALALGWRHVRSRMVLALALLALPAVWAFQFLGGAPPQWGGRYVLVSSTLLTVAGVVGAGRLPPRARTAAFALAGLVTAFGLMWLSVRSHEVARAESTLVRRPEPVLVSRLAHLAREGGGFYGDRLWLTAVEDADVGFAADVLTRAGITGFGLVEPEGDPPTEAPPGFTAQGADRLQLFPDYGLRITTFRATVASDQSAARLVE